MDDAEKWNAIYSRSTPAPQSACKVLRENTHLLPMRGSGLDLACGRAANAILLAEHGLNVTAWDLSEIVIDSLAKLTSNNNKITAQVRDIVTLPPATDSFDVIVVSHFLNRQLIPAIKQALRKQGLIFYQSYTANKIGCAGPANPEYLFRDNELLQLFNDCRLLVYREEGRVGDLNRGFRSEAMLIAQKR